MAFRTAGCARQCERMSCPTAFGDAQANPRNRARYLAGPSGERGTKSFGHGPRAEVAADVLIDRPNSPQSFILGAS